MARIKGVENHEAGWFTRFVFWMVKRRFGKVMEPIRITAHHPRLLKAVGQMEMGQVAARTVDAALKALVDIKVAMQIGCPF
jgi:hypothetical protein